MEDPEESKNDSFRDGNNDAGDKNTEHIEKEQTDDVEMEEQELSHVSQDTEVSRHCETNMKHLAIYTC